MKKLFVIISSLVVSFALAVSAFGAAPTEQQLTTLKNYGIFEGDADGSLRLDEPLIRAESAKLICTLLCMKEMNDGIVPFPDIMTGNWAAGWISTAKTIGIVSGDENGNFRPGDFVTNEEYIKMLINALGYAPLAQQRGDFPAGYIAVANTYGITEGMQFGVGEYALRGDIALMTYRALDVPVMCQTGFGSQVEYAVMDGKNGHDHRTLRKELDPNYVYPKEEETEDIADDGESLPLSDSIYKYVDVQVSGLSVRAGAYSFFDQKRGSDSPKYVVDSSTYVYTGDDTIPISQLSDGMLVRLLCTDKDSSGIATVLGIEIYENRINSKIISQNK